MKLQGFRSIEECLKSEPSRIQRIIVHAKQLTVREENLLQEAKRLQIPIEYKKTEIYPKGQRSDREHITALLKDYAFTDFEVLTANLHQLLKAGRRPAVLVLDGIMDPHNLGAIIRSAAFMGICAIILPKDRSVTVTDTVIRIASGGIEHVSLVQVVNISQALKSLKDLGFWIVGFSEHAKDSLKSIKQNFAPVIVIGNEEKGMRHLVQEQCDFLVSLQGGGTLRSLNASVAAALAMAWATQLLDP